MVLLDKLKSRKFWFAIVGAVVAIVGESVGIPPEAVAWVVKILGIYIVGEAVVDSASCLRRR